METGRLTNGVSRREIMRFSGMALAASALGWNALDAAAGTGRSRVIVDNDFSGDPDGLFQLAHHLLSPSVDIPLIVGSHLHPGEAWTGDKNRQATSAAAKARELLDVMKLRDRYTVLAGAETAIPRRADWMGSPATAAIVAEATRTDSRLPLYYAAGAGLTELALAWLTEPAIGKRIRLVWIGGSEHPGMANPPPGGSKAEYNLTIDVLAAQVIFNESDIEIWQVPRDVYRQTLFSIAELDELARESKLGRYLKGEIDKVRQGAVQRSKEGRQLLGETYILGDNPLVTLTALQSPFEPDPSSSRYSVLPTPKIASNGLYETNPSGRPMRVYTTVDTRLTFEDMVSKFRSTERV